MIYDTHKVLLYRIAEGKKLWHSTLSCQLHPDLHASVQLRYSLHTVCQAELLKKDVAYREVLIGGKDVIQSHAPLPRPMHRAPADRTLLRTGNRTDPHRHADILPWSLRVPVPLLRRSMATHALS